MSKSPESQLTKFDPQKVASLEAGMWRNYYDIKDKGLFERLKAAFNLFTGLSRLCQEQFQFSQSRSLKMASLLFAAAVVFGLNKKNRLGSHEKISLPLVQKAYTIVQSGASAEFNPKVTATHELAWWQTHRASRENPEQLLSAIESMGDLFVEIYQIPDKELRVAAFHRVTAAVKRDRKASIGNLTENDWHEIEQNLIQCYSLIKETA